MRSGGKTARGLPRLAGGLAGILILAAISMGFLYFFQHSLIYHPRRYGAAELQMLQESGGRRLEFVTTAGKQSAYYVPARAAKANNPIWVMFCGNASTALDWLYLIQHDALRSQSFLLVDYPGYGFSEGRAGIVSTREAAAGALKALAEHLQVDGSALEPRLNAGGQSLGAAAALDFAAEHHANRVLLIAPFTSLRDVAAHLFARPFAWLLAENYDNVERLAELAKRNPPPRIALFHGTEDTLVPIFMARRLAEAHPQIISFFPIEGADHNDVVPLSENAIVRWLAEE